MKKILSALWALGACAALGLSMVPGLLEFTDGRDKILHVAAYCLLMLWPAIIFSRTFYIYMAAGILLAGSAAIEILQQYSGRHSSIEDFLANAAGIALGLLIGYLLKSGLGMNNHGTLSRRRI